MISYRKDDCAARPRGDGSAPRWKAALEQQGWQVFLDQAEIEAGDFWEETIIAAVKGCDVMLALISTGYAESRWCKEELKLASDRGKHIIPIFHSGVYPPEALVLRLGSVQSVPSGEPMRPEDFDLVAETVVSVIKRKVGHKLGLAPPGGPAQQPQAQSSQPQSRQPQASQAQASPPPMQAAVISFSSGSLDELVAKANTCSQATVLDLCGALFTSSSKDQVFTLWQNNVTLRNGELGLSGTQRLVVSAKNVRMEGIRVVGPSAAPAGYEVDFDTPKGLVECGGGGGALLRLVKCVLSGGGGSEAVLLVCAGCRVELSEGCWVSGHPVGAGFCVRGAGSSMMATDCSFVDNHDSGMSVSTGGSAELQGCQLSGSKTSKGLVVNNEGSRVLAKDCKMLDNQGSGVAVATGGSAERQGCQLSGSKAFHGLLVENGGTRAVAKDCRMVNIQDSGVVVRAGGSAELQGCQLSGSKTGKGLVVNNEGSQVVAKDCKLLDNQGSGVAVATGGSAELHGCQMSGSKAFHGLLVENEGSRGVAKDCKMVDNHDSGVLVRVGGSTELQGCVATGNMADSFFVRDAGSRLALRGGTWGTAGCDVRGVGHI